MMRIPRSATTTGSLAISLLTGASLLAIADRARTAEVLTGFASLPFVSGVPARTDTSITVATDRGPITVHVATPQQRGAALLWHTGSRGHNDLLSMRAARFAVSTNAASIGSNARPATRGPLPWTTLK